MGSEATRRWARPSDDLRLQAEERAVAFRGGLDAGALARCRFSEQRQRDRHGVTPQRAPPGSDDPPGYDDDGGQEAAPGIDPPDVERAQHRGAIAIGDQVLVEGRQEVGVGQRLGGDTRRLAGPPLCDAGDRL
jgi:hypothetical protein